MKPAKGTSRWHKLAPVFRLLARRRPAAVAGFVIAIVVYSVNRMNATRARSHIRKERFKGSPPITDADATFMVAVVMPWLASFAQVDPRNELRRSFPAARIPVQEMAWRSLVPAVATRDAPAGSHGAEIADRLKPALATDGNDWAGLHPNHGPLAELVANRRFLHGVNMHIQFAKSNPFQFASGY